MSTKPKYSKNHASSVAWMPYDAREYYDHKEKIASKKWPIPVQDNRGNLRNVNLDTYKGDPEKERNPLNS
jgi:hypothetical protein